MEDYGIKFEIPFKLRKTVNKRKTEIAQISHIRFDHWSHTIASNPIKAKTKKANEWKTLETVKFETEFLFFM